MADSRSFQEKQYAFAAHIRDPQHRPAPDAIEDRRMAIYRELFFNNLFKLLGSTFPVLRKVYGDAGWRRMVREFMIGHHASTPYFLEIPKEFIAFLQDEFQPGDDDPPFLLELAHYEWAELALSVSDAANSERCNPDGDLASGVPVKSVLAWLLNYRFPVHRIDNTFQPNEPGEQPVFLVMYRRSDDELGFKELNPVTARLLEMIDNNEQGLGGEQLLQQLADETRYPDPDALLAHGLSLMQDMRADDILLGTLQPD